MLNADPFKNLDFCQSHLSFHPRIWITSLDILIRSTPLALQLITRFGALNSLRQTINDRYSIWTVLQLMDKNARDTILRSFGSNLRLLIHKIKWTVLQLFFKKSGSHTQKPQSLYRYGKIVTRRELKCMESMFG